MDDSPYTGARNVVKIRSNSRAMLSGKCQGNVWRYLVVDNSEITPPHAMPNCLVMEKSTVW